MEIEGNLPATENEISDWVQDISSHVNLKNRVHGNTAENFEYFNSLSQDFVVPNPNGEPAFVQFLGEIYDFAKCQLLKPLEINGEKDDKESNGPHVNKTEEDYIKDPHYEIFLENSSLDGKTLVLEIARDNVGVRYDERNIESNSGNNTDFGDNHGFREKHASLGTNMDSEAETHGSENVGMAVDVGTNHVSLETNMGSEAKKHIPETKGTCKRVRRRGKPKKVPETSAAGPSIKRVKVDVRNQNRREVSGVSSDTKMKEGINKGNAPKRKLPAAKKEREFREELIDILQKPYCEKERETLYQKISHRPPKQGTRVLRGQTKSYDDKRAAGKSYLDHFADLAKIIDSVRDERPRVLNLLRGFFYWIEKISRDGAFIPWKDPMCLGVLPAKKK